MHTILPREELAHHLVAQLSNLSIGQKEIILSRMTHHKVNQLTPFTPPSSLILGEICIGGPIVTAGYWKMPDKTAEDYFEEDGLRYFRTGDVGQWEADGALRIIDRNCCISSRDSRWRLTNGLTHGKGYRSDYDTLFYTCHLFVSVSTNPIQL